MSTTNNSLETVKTFLKRCYEIGNTPLWELRNVNARPMANSPAKRNREEPKRSIAKDSGGYTVFNLEGLIQPGTNAKFSINGEDFDVNHDTWVVGVIRLGALARVRGTSKPDRPRLATKVVIL